MSAPSALSSSVYPDGTAGRFRVTGGAVVGVGSLAPGAWVAGGALGAHGVAGPGVAAGEHAPTTRAKTAIRIAIVDGFLLIDSSSMNPLAVRSMEFPVAIPPLFFFICLEVEVHGSAAR